jgi:hypothetical protein
MKENERLYPISKELFNEKVLPIIEANYIWKGRPPRVKAIWEPVELTLLMGGPGGPRPPGGGVAGAAPLGPSVPWRGAPEDRRAVGRGETSPLLNYWNKAFGQAAKRYKFI